MSLTKYTNISLPNKSQNTKKLLVINTHHLYNFEKNLRVGQTLGLNLIVTVLLTTMFQPIYSTAFFSYENHHYGMLTAQIPFILSVSYHPFLLATTLGKFFKTASSDHTEMMNVSFSWSPNTKLGT